MGRRVKVHTRYPHTSAHIHNCHGYVRTHAHTHTHPRIDIDECTGENDCGHTCTNTHGSYECSCLTGYELSEDGKSCSGELL